MTKKKRSYRNAFIIIIVLLIIVGLAYYYSNLPQGKTSPQQSWVCDKFEFNRTYTIDAGSVQDLSFICPFPITNENDTWLIQNGHMFESEFCWKYFPKDVLANFNNWAFPIKYADMLRLDFSHDPCVYLRGNDELVNDCKTQQTVTFIGYKEYNCRWQ